MSVRKFNPGDVPLTSAVDDHNKYAKNPGTDPFGKKFFAGGDFKMDDAYHVALMVGWAG
jgi:hypothetical protein